MKPLPFASFYAWPGLQNNKSLRSDTPHREPVNCLCISQNLVVHLKEVEWGDFADELKHWAVGSDIIKSREGKR